MPRAAPHDPSPARDLRPVAHRRGSVAVAVLIAMVVLTLVVFSVVRGGLHDREISATRVQSSRAFYAAEAATNIALAEVFNNTDHDGAIGANAILGFHYDASDVGGSAKATEVLCYGTAVVIVPSATEG